MYADTYHTHLALLMISCCMLACSGDGDRGVGEHISLDAEMVDSAFSDAQAYPDDGQLPERDVSLSRDGGRELDAALSDVSMTDMQGRELDASTTDVSSNVDAALSPQMDMGAAPWQPGPTPVQPIVVDTGPSLELLLVGDNYVGLNELCDKISALAEGAALWESVQCELVSSGGFRLINHADAAASGERLGAYLDPQDPARIQFDLMVLQERAQVAGFPNGQPFRTDFEQAAEELSIRANAAGIPTALLMTWGRDGDPNVGLYPNYQTMQRRIAQAHYEVAQNIATTGQDVAVIEAGEVWFRTHVRDPGVDFTALFMPNDHHPSDTGSWLLAAVILSRSVGLSPNMLPIVPSLPPSDLWLRLKGDVLQPE